MVEILILKKEIFLLPDLLGMGNTFEFTKI